LVSVWYKAKKDEKEFNGMFYSFMKEVLRDKISILN